MNFLLKIVEGPNRGAEIALVEGVAVSLGKSDDCDIVLADSTMGDEPFKLGVTADGVSLDGEPLEPYRVVVRGSTAFAVGPADSAWGALKWPEKEAAEEPKAGTSDTAEEDREEKKTPEAAAPRPEEGGEESKPRRKRGGCCGCFAVLVLAAVALAVLGWFYRAAIQGFCKEKGYDIDLSEARLPDWHLPSFGFFEKERPSDRQAADMPTLSSVVAKYGLSLEEKDGVAKISGNLKTRAERLRATAEAYAVKPGVELDISDDESFKTTCEDALFTLSEGALTVAAATNRCLSVAGAVADAASLKRVLSAVSADIPRLKAVDCSKVAFSAVAKKIAPEESVQADSAAPVVKRATPAAKPFVALPVCGILTTPYPCIVTKSGARVFEGAEIGGSTILKIEADSVTLTNSMGRFSWKP